MAYTDPIYKLLVAGEFAVRNFLILLVALLCNFSSLAAHAADPSGFTTLEIGDGPTAGSRQVSLDVFWQTPDSDEIHRYAATAVVGAN